MNAEPKEISETDIVKLLYEILDPFDTGSINDLQADYTIKQIGEIFGYDLAEALIKEGE